jgi:hypothetical protein
MKLPAIQELIAATEAHAAVLHGIINTIDPDEVDRENAIEIVRCMSIIGILTSLGRLSAVMSRPHLGPLMVQILQEYEEI